MFKLLGIQSKKQEPKYPSSLSKAQKYEFAKHNIKTKIRILEVDQEGQNAKLEELDKCIRQLLFQDNQLEAYKKIAELKGYYKQFETKKMKRDVLNEMKSQMDRLEQYTNLLDVYTDEVSISKDKINDQVLNIMLDYNEFLLSHMDKYLRNQVVNQVELNETFVEYQQEIKLFILHKTKANNDIKSKIQVIDDNMEKQLIQNAGFNKEIQGLLNLNKSQEAMEEIGSIHQALMVNQQQIQCKKNSKNMLSSLIIDIQNLEDGNMLGVMKIVTSIPEDNQAQETPKPTVLKEEAKLKSIYKNVHFIDDHLLRMDVDVNELERQIRELSIYWKQQSNVQIDGIDSIEIKRTNTKLHGKRNMLTQMVDLIENYRDSVANVISVDEDHQQVREINQSSLRTQGIPQKINNTETRESEPSQSIIIEVQKEFNNQFYIKTNKQKSYEIDQCQL